MPLIKLSEVRNRASFTESYTRKSAGQILESKAVQLSLEVKTYDVFLSHSYSDKKTILGIVDLLEDFDLSVYVDWIVDKQLDRSKVTKYTALSLKERMDNCRCLLYAHTVNASESVWMPWELGYFDGLKGRVAILPLSQATNPGDSYDGREYLGIYPYVSKDKIRGSKEEALWVNESADCYVRLSGWLNGKEPYEH